jgi:L-alanine-DL-glutamate epimerase-like enolase superfamily enzyme
MLHDLIEEKVEVKDGMIAIPDRPGLGITVREDIVSQHAVHFQ